MVQFERLEDRRLLAAAPTVNIHDVQQAEGDSGTSSFVFTVTRSGKVNSSSEIDYRTTSDTAVEGDDFQPASGTLNFAPGERTKTISIAINGDTAPEGDESFSVDLDIVSNGKFGDSEGIGTILNDDAASALPSISINDVPLSEGDSGTKAFVFTVSRSGDISQESTVDFATADGTATTGVDYDANNGTLTFPANDSSSQTITVQVSGDIDDESDETFTVELSKPAGATISDGQGIGTITNDDSDPPVPGGDPVDAPSGLVSWWTADGTATDLMNRNDATVAGGNSIPTYTTGKVGQALQFDGINDRAIVSDSASLQLTESLTIEGWVRIDSFPESGSRPIFFRGDRRGGLDPYSVGVTRDPVTQEGLLRFKTSGLNNVDKLTTPVSAGEFIHVAATLDDANGRKRIYINGQVAAETVTDIRPFRDLHPGQNPGIGIGNHSGDLFLNNSPFHGLIDELSVYNRALSVEEVQSIYDAGGSGKNSMIVTTTTPDLSEVVSAPPTIFVVNFSSPINAASLSNTDLAVNGVTADSVTLNDSDRATFSFGTSPATGEGSQAMHMDAGAVTRATDGLGLGAYDAVFRFDTVPLTVVSTDPPIGSPLNVDGSGSATLRIDFNESIDPTTVGLADLIVDEGTVVDAQIIDADTVEYTLSDATPDLALGMSLGAVADQFGNPMAHFSAQYYSGITTFYVVNDGASDSTYEYGRLGDTLNTDQSLSVGNTASRGIATTASREKLWIIDANKTVYVYRASDNLLLGSWTAGGVQRPEGITTDGTDIWIVDGKSHKVLRYSGAAATMPSGTRSASSSFSLPKGRGVGPAKDLVTDGSSLWIVRDSDGSATVLKYTLNGEPVGNWRLWDEPRPTGITLDPLDPDHLWVVDAESRRVLQYSHGVNFTGGGKYADAFFELDAGNTNPQGIADPPLPKQTAPVAYDPSGVSDAAPPVESVPEESELQRYLHESGSSSERPLKVPGDANPPSLLINQSFGTSGLLSDDQTDGAGYAPLRSETEEDAIHSAGAWVISDAQAVDRALADLRTERPDLEPVSDVLDNDDLLQSLADTWRD